MLRILPQTAELELNSHDIKAPILLMESWSTAIQQRESSKILVEITSFHTKGFILLYNGPSLGQLHRARDVAPPSRGSTQPLIAV